MTKHQVSHSIMTKRKKQEPSERTMVYRDKVSRNLKNELKPKIIDVVVKQRRYLDKDYSARQLAEDIGTDIRYVSAIISSEYKMNYSAFINKYRVKRAEAILSSPRFAKLTMEEVGDMVGFANRQTFYSAFRSFKGITPADFRRMILKSRRTGSGDNNKV